GGWGGGGGGGAGRPGRWVGDAHGEEPRRSECRERRRHAGQELQFGKRARWMGAALTQQRPVDDSVAIEKHGCAPHGAVASHLPTERCSSGCVTSRCQMTACMASVCAVTAAALTVGTITQASAARAV